MATNTVSDNSLACALEHAQTRARKREEHVRKCSKHVREGVRRSLAELDSARKRMDAARASGGSLDPGAEQLYRDASMRFRAVARFAVPLILLTAEADADASGGRSAQSPRGSAPGTPGPGPSGAAGGSASDHEALDALLRAHLDSAAEASAAAAAAAAAVAAERAADSSPSPHDDGSAAERGSLFAAAAAAAVTGGGGGGGGGGGSDAENAAPPLGADPLASRRLLARFIEGLRRDAGMGQQRDERQQEADASPAAEASAELAGSVFENVSASMAASFTGVGAAGLQGEQPWENLSAYEEILEGCCLMETAVAETRARLARLEQRHLDTLDEFAAFRRACEHVSTLQDDNRSLRHELEAMHERVRILEAGRRDAEERAAQSEVLRKRAEARAAEYKRIIFASDWKTFFSKQTLMLLVHVLVGGSLLLSSSWRSMPSWLTRARPHAGGRRVIRVLGGAR